MVVTETLQAKEVLDKFHLDVVEKLARESMESVRYDDLYEDFQFEAHVLDIASGSWGWRMFEPLADFFGIEYCKDRAEVDSEYQIEIHEQIDSFISNVEFVMNEYYEHKLPGKFHFGYHESDGSFCLFYT